MSARFASFSIPKTTRVAIALALLTFAASAASAADQAKYDLFKQVQKVVLQYPFFTVFDDVSTVIGDEGAVTLIGSVTGDHKRVNLEKRVAAIAGVTSVTNDLRLLPASTFDDRLRYKVARAIYSNPHFWGDAARLNPPIHIVVNRGHVTLTGVVQSEVDRALANTLARQFDAFSVTNELRLPAEVTAELEQLG